MATLRDMRAKKPGPLWSRKLADLLPSLGSGEEREPMDIEQIKVVASQIAAQANALAERQP